MVQGECPICEEEQLKRELRGLRRRSTGKLRTSVLLYNELHPDESEILATFNSDLRQSVDAVIIMGTRLQIGDLRSFVDSLCRGAGDKERMIVWANRTHSEPDIGVNYQYIGDCDEFASLVLDR